MHRRDLILTTSAASVAVMLPGVALASPSSAPHIDGIITAMVDAFIAETRCYRAAADDTGNAADARCDEATNGAYRAGLRLLNQPMADAMGSPDYLPALALIHRRWLIMEGSYSNEADRNECMLVDVALAGHRFDAVPMLWHIDGDLLLCRPSEAELQAGWGGRS